MNKTASKTPGTPETPDILTAPAVEGHYPLTEDDLIFFRKHGYIKLKNVLTPEEIAWYEKEITAFVNDASDKLPPFEDRDLYGKAFVQCINLWLKRPSVKGLIFSKRLARIAAELLEVTGARLYHDQALYKTPGDGNFTPWHVDQHYWPLASEKTVTAWIPLQETPLEMGPLQIAPETQHVVAGRELEISAESEEKIHLNFKDIAKDETPYDLGEISFHLGYTFHRAGPNLSSTTRKVITVIYMEEDMTLREPKNPQQVNDANSFCKGIKPGEIVDTEITPVLWSSRV